MSKVRLLVGTRKGAFVMTADGTRNDWDVQGPLFAGWEMYHLKGSPADPDRLYASQSTGWHGQVMQRSDDGGKTWEPVGNEFAYDGVPGTHQWYDGTPHPWEFARVWHLEPSLDRPGHRLRGRRGRGAVPVRPTAARRGRSCRACASTDRPALAAGRRRACACTRSCSTRATPSGCSSRSRRRARSARDDGGETWKPINRGLRSKEHPGRGRRGRPLRPPHRDAPVAARTCCSCRSTGT